MSFNCLCLRRRRRRHRRLRRCHYLPIGNRHRTNARALEHLLDNNSFLMS